MPILLDPVTVSEVRRLKNLNHGLHGVGVPVAVAGRLREGWKL